MGVLSVYAGDIGADVFAPGQCSPGLGEKMNAWRPPAAHQQSVAIDPATRPDRAIRLNRRNKHGRDAQTPFRPGDGVPRQNLDPQPGGRLEKFC
ncbi:hypothetical protein MnTg02_03354 [bacterium MnTg02]|nr:hypothetical protein MnTg02_03354 [bacterium MnTg02]